MYFDELFCISNMNLGILKVWYFRTNFLSFSMLVYIFYSVLPITHLAFVTLFPLSIISSTHTHPPTCLFPLSLSLSLSLSLFFFLSVSLPPPISNLSIVIVNLPKNLICDNIDPFLARLFASNVFLHSIRHSLEI